MKKIHLIILISAVLITSGGCKKYLEKESKKLATIQTVEQLEALLNNASRFVQENNYTATYSTDDTEIRKEDYKNNAGEFTPEALYFYLFTNDQVENNIAADQLWAGEYNKIFTANVVLTNIETAEGNDALREKAESRCIFCSRLFLLVTGQLLLSSLFSRKCRSKGVATESKHCIH